MNEKVIDEMAQEMYRCQMHGMGYIDYEIRMFRLNNLTEQTRDHYRKLARESYIVLEKHGCITQ